MQGTIKNQLNDRLHVAIIMDGNGRWATRQGLPRHEGHRAGVKTVRRMTEAAPELGIGTLTLYAFSSDNWQRPPSEVSALMGLLKLYLKTETARLIRDGIRLSVIGRRDRLPDGIPELIDRAEKTTALGQSLHLRIALDYSARDSILRAVEGARELSNLDRDGFAALITGDPELRDVDLLIRTSGEQRLSDFLLWECAYAELHFTQTHWPDFCAGELQSALDEFDGRERRFGGLPGKSYYPDELRA